MKPSISQENKKIIKFLTTIILILIIIIIIYISCVYVNSELYEYVYPHVQNDMHMNFINYLVDGIICVLGSYIGFYISDKYINKKKSLADIDTVLCSIRPKKREVTEKEINAAGETKGGVSGGLQLEVTKELINKLIEAIRESNIEEINNIFQNELEWVKCGYQEDTTEFLKRIIGERQEDIVYEGDNGQIIREKIYKINNSINSNYYFADVQFKLKDINSNRIFDYAKNIIDMAQNRAVVYDTSYGDFNRNNIRITDKFKYCIGFVQYTNFINTKDNKDLNSTRGHYIAYIQYNDGWYCFNDKYVQKFNTVNEMFRHMGRGENYSIKNMIFGTKLKDIKINLKKYDVDNYKHLGLNNNRNICYSNSALQLLIATDLLDDDESNKKQPREEPTQEKKLNPEKQVTFADDTKPTIQKSQSEQREEPKIQKTQSEPSILSKAVSVVRRVSSAILGVTEENEPTPQPVTNQIPNKSNEDKVNELIDGLTKFAKNKLRYFTKYDDIFYLEKPKDYLHKCGILNENKNLYSETQNQELKGLYHKIILDRDILQKSFQVDYSIIQTKEKIINEFLNQNQDYIIKQIIDNIDSDLKNTITELTNQNNKKIADQLKTLCMKVYNINENLKKRITDNNDELFENEDDIEGVNGTDDDRELDNLNTEVNKIKTGIYAELINNIDNDNKCITFEELLKENNKENESNENYIPDIKDLLKALLNSLVKTLNTNKSKRIVRKIKQQIKQIVELLKVHIKKEEEIRAIDRYINIIIQIIENRDYDDEDGEGEDEQFHMYMPLKKPEKNKRYGADNTPFDEFFKELTSDNI